MAYGVISTTFLLGIGLTPAAASATVHTAEVFTTAVAAVSHVAIRNVDWRLVRALALPGVAGGVLGAYGLTEISGEVVRPFVAAYLLALGALLLYRAITGRSGAKTRKGLVPLGFAGGFLDAIGGGGWGPVVTATLVAAGSAPRQVIGSASVVEFFLSTAVAGTFFLRLGLGYEHIVLGLLVGGVIAAPLSAYLAKAVPGRVLMGLVGVMVSVLSARTLYLALS
ncbi:MAG: sulfite exporter TauE/SafE family protein [Pseudomonadota bacterium]